MTKIFFHQMFRLVAIHWIWVFAATIYLLAGITPHVMSAQDEVLCYPSDISQPNGSIPLSSKSINLVENSSIGASYTIKLCSEPTADVEIFMIVDDPWAEQVNVKPASVVIKPEEWNTETTISIKAIDNNEPANESGFHITHRAQSNDPDYDDFEKNDPPTHFPRIQVKYLDDEKGMRFPLITNEYRADKPQQWRKFFNITGDIDVITMDHSRLFVGNRDEDSLTNGLFATDLQNSQCEPSTLQFAKIVSGVKVSDIVFNDSGIGLMASNGNGLFATNNGMQWTSIGNFPDPFAFAVRFVDNRIYAGSDDGVFQSVDSGQNWVGLGGSSTPRLINTFTYESDMLWIATYGLGVWSIDKGSTTPQDRSANLTESDGNRRVWDIAISPSSNVYIGTTKGIYQRNSRHGGWDHLGTALREIQVLSLAIYRDEFLYAGTKDIGLWVWELGKSTEWQKITIDGAPTLISVRDIFIDDTAITLPGNSNNPLCDDPTSAKPSLLLATTNGLWIYR